MQNVLDCLSRGGVAVYPTETLYALGCAATDQDACARVVALKKRPQIKPLPLIIGWQGGLELVTDHVPFSLISLAEHFWPGPLSVLVRARESLAPQVSDKQGFTSVRLSPHPVAAALSRELGVPLVATSANISGHEATADPEALDPDLLAGVDASYLDAPLPLGGAPSTVIRPGNDNEIEVVRAGAVAVHMLEAEGFVITNR
ncbi:L-threonylcarbamoyladenylate synthase [Pseudodesulfovibrio senegalensis]|uniref:L-threonylcarbamoyladenylate synthase n=1 Tax=Pseudodesulfovibrio senegalensis TaxID=1721087 RepID=A0A6N6N388_9BACT|nr:L-threonylcarbamoyladenylate synthase [Pseudodesulfovibrio senegalensis]KAB1442295.1 threonylcarbamoyl-AMP synthase [Pseudodesulfovibrio senegalensis]